MLGLLEDTEGTYPCQQPSCALLYTRRIALFFAMCVRTYLHAAQRR